MDEIADKVEPMRPVYRHICEACGLTEDLTVDESFEQGWDYPPRVGEFGAISPRTCPSCPITDTLWWRVTTGQAKLEALTDEELAFVRRVQAEPVSILLSN